MFEKIEKLEEEIQVERIKANQKICTWKKKYRYSKRSRTDEGSTNTQLYERRKTKNDVHLIKKKT